MLGKRVLNYIIDGIIILLFTLHIANTLKSFAIAVSASNVISVIVHVGLIGLAIFLICAATFNAQEEDKIVRYISIGVIAMLFSLAFDLLIVIINGAYTETYVAFVFLLIAIVIEIIAMFAPILTMFKTVSLHIPSIIGAILIIVMMCLPSDMAYISYDYFKCLLFFGVCGLKIASIHA